MQVASTEATNPKTIAHRKRPTVRWWNGGRPGRDKENVPNPVNEFKPTKINEPIPAASSPGTRTSPRIGPPMPATSINRKAPRMGEPKRVLIAAKLPAEVITIAAVGGASRAASRTARAPSPPPSAMSGASGPRTTPREREANAAITTPGRSSAPMGGPSEVNPSAGTCPAVPGR